MPPAVPLSFRGEGSRTYFCEEWHGYASIPTVKGKSHLSHNRFLVLNYIIQKIVYKRVMLSKLIKCLKENIVVVVIAPIITGILSTWLYPFVFPEHKQAHGSIN